MVVHKSIQDYLKAEKVYISINDKMKKKSMLRSQDTKPLYSIFSGEFFSYQKN